MKKVLCTVALLATVLLVGCADISLAKSSAFNGMSADNNSQSVGLLASRSGLYCINYPLWTADGFFGKGAVDYNATLTDLTKEARRLGTDKLTTIVPTEESIWIAPTFVLFYKKSTVAATCSK